VRGAELPAAVGNAVAEAVEEAEAVAGASGRFTQAGSDIVLRVGKRWAAGSDHRISRVHDLPRELARTGVRGDAHHHLIPGAGPDRRARTIAVGVVDIASRVRVAVIASGADGGGSAGHALAIDRLTCAVAVGVIDIAARVRVAVIASGADGRGSAGHAFAINGLTDAVAVGIVNVASGVRVTVIAGSADGRGSAGRAFAINGLAYAVAVGV